MKKTAIAAALLALAAATPVAHAGTSTYNVITTWYEPDTQPNDSIFKGSFTYDNVTHSVTNLHGILSESMTGDSTGYPNDSMTWLTLSNQLVSWYDTNLHGTFAATFLNTNTATFFPYKGDNWSPTAGVKSGGVYFGFPDDSANPGNAYALIFIPDNPVTQLTQAQINKLAYADCSPGGMMGATCMTGTSKSGYGAIGTMSGVPVSQTITAVAAVPEPETYAMLMAGLGLMGGIARRRRQQQA